MTSEALFLKLADFEATRQTLHWYSRAMGVIPRAHAEFHPKWWHISLKVESDGLITDKMSRPGGGSFWLKMNLKQHKVTLFIDEGPFKVFDMTQGLTATEFGDEILAAVAELGLSGDYAREKFENDDPREYRPQTIEPFLTSLVNADRIFKEHRASLTGDVGPVQLWPHGFDLAFEWFGTRVERYEEHGEVQEYPSQINLGFYPGDPDNEPYFYSNPWPFEAEVLLSASLPNGARWHTEGWQGSVLPYDELVGDAQAEARLKNYARAVYELAAPTLLAQHEGNG